MVDVKVEFLSLILSIHFFLYAHTLLKDDRNTLVDSAHVLMPELVKRVQQNLGARTFSHATPETNVQRILAEGLQTQYGGTDRGISGLETHVDFKLNSKNSIHLGYDAFGCGRTSEKGLG